MSDIDPAEYGRHIADDYDRIYGQAFRTDDAVEQLARLAEGGPILELGVGTGRLAIPLTRRGLAVHGVDGSEQMLKLLRERPGGPAVSTTHGDFSEVHVDPPEFSLVVLAINTIFALETQDAKVRCFENAAHHLRPGGRFVVEAWVPEALPAGSSLRTRPLSPGFFGLVAAEHDPATQTLATTQVVLNEEMGVRVFPVVHHYAWPSELDLMARIAGMALEHRWADWRRTPFDAASANHVSVYRVPG
jgi:SAM-dependent methyltransferase